MDASRTRADRPSEDADVPYVPHVGATRQYWRDIILGVNDGLVSVFLLVAGVVGGGLTADQALLAIIAAAVAGAISMGAGEYLATRSQEEVFDREIALEREHIAHHTEMEIDQLRGMFTDMGVAPEDLEHAVEAFSKDPETLLNAMKVLEFGVVDSERRSPYYAMLMSGVWFLVGSLPSVVPFLLLDDVPLAFGIAAVFTAIGLFAVGVFKTKVTGTNPVAAGFQNLIIAGLGGMLAYGIGALFGSQVG